MNARGVAAKPPPVAFGSLFFLGAECVVGGWWNLDTKANCRIYPPGDIHDNYTHPHLLDLLLDTIALVVVDGRSPITIATITLRIALPMSKFNIPIGMYTGDDDEEFNNHVLKEDAGLELGYVEPYVAAKETLWLVPGIDNIVRGALRRMAKAFAYNSAYFLKVILDLQVTYLGLNPAPAPDTVLDRNLVLRIAEIMAGRMARRDRDNNSPSRELQLRTLVSALTLLYQIKIEKLEDYTYAKLLKDVSERDSDNQTKFEEGRGNYGKPSNGDVEFLVRYACDLIRCLPSDLPNFNDSNSQAMNVHFLFAAGFINQLDGETTPEALDKIFARIRAPSSEWHKDMRHLYEGTAGAISLHHQALSKSPSRISQYAGNLAAEVTRSIVDRAEQELEALSSRQDLTKRLKYMTSESFPTHEAHLLISGLLDLLSQLVAAFQSSEYIQREAKSLSMNIIHTSDRPEFRYKAFEIIISSTSGCSEAEYYTIMRDLDLVIDQYFGALSGPDASDEKSLRMEELKIEKRDAMDRCEKRAILYKGAVESMQRRIQSPKSGVRSSTHPFGDSQTIGESMRLTSSWPPVDDGARSATTASPVPSSMPSQAPTLSSMAPTCDSFFSPSIISPTETCTLLSPTDTCHTLLSTMSRLQAYESLEESPILPNLYQTPHLTPSISYPAPLTPQEAITPGFYTMLRFDHLDQLSTESIFDEPEDYPEDSNISMSSLDLPIQTFDDKNPTLPVYVRREEHSSCSGEFHQFRRNSDESTRLSSFISQVLIEPPEPSPKSTYPEPSLSRTPSGYTQTSPPSRRSRASRIFGHRAASAMNLEAPRPHNLQLNKPLPRLDKAEDAPEPIIPDIPPAIIEPIRSHSSMEMRSERGTFNRMRSNSALGHNRSNSYEPRMPIFSGVETVPVRANTAIEYESQPDEDIFKVQPKDSCFSVFISSDAKYAVYLSPHAFRVFEIPRRGESYSPKPKFRYRLGESEGLRKGKVPWAYKNGAASDKYVVTVTKERVQVHDLEQECKVIFTEVTKGWENSCVAIAVDKLVVGLSKTLRGENVGMIRIFKMNAPTYPGLRCEKLRDIHLPINPRQPQDAPHMLSVSKDGNYLTCGTPKHGYYFAWDMSRARTTDPIRIATGRVKVTDGHGSEMLSTAILFPDTKHILCSTFPTSSSEAEWNGSFTEPIGSDIDKPLPSPIRQVGLRVTDTAIAPLGNAAAFLTKSGTIWVTQVSHLEGDDNLTTFAPTHTKERLQNQQLPETAGRMMFTPEGDCLVAADRKGKIMVLTFRKTGLSPVLLPSMKLEVGGFF